MASLFCLRQAMLARMPKSVVWQPRLLARSMKVRVDRDRIELTPVSKNLTSSQVLTERLIRSWAQAKTFAADFNEDFSAFHAATLREQAEFLADAIPYILSLYEDATGRPRPTSVILLAHSMGGIASRLAFLQPDFKPGSVKTIVTFSTPHAVPPVSFDSSLEQVYTDINEHWRTELSRNNSNLADVLLISIAGGTADTTVASDYSAISSFTPVSNGFTVFTTSVPTLFSPVDHLAMVWCDQLRKRVIQALFKGIDGSKPTKSRSLDERLSAMKFELVNGLVDTALPLTTKDKLVHIASSSIISFESSYIRLEGHWKGGWYALRAPVGTDSEVAIWTSLTSSQLDLLSCEAVNDDYECETIEGVTFVSPGWASTSGSVAMQGVVAQFKMPHGRILLINVPEGAAGFLFAGYGAQRNVVNPTLSRKSAIDSR